MGRAKGQTAATAAHALGFNNVFGTRRGRLASHRPRSEDVKFDTARLLWDTTYDENTARDITSHLVRQIQAGDPGYAIELLNVGGQLHIDMADTPSALFTNAWLAQRPNPHAAAVLDALVAHARQPSEEQASEALTALTSQLWLKPTPRLSAAIKRVRHGFDASAYIDCLRAMSKGQLTEESATSLADWTTGLTRYLGNYCYRNNDMVLRAFELQNMGSLGPAAWDEAASVFCHAVKDGDSQERALAKMSEQLRKALGL